MGQVEFRGPQPPPGCKFCAFCAGFAKGDVADVNADRIRALDDGQRMVIPVGGDPPLAVAQTMLMMPLPPDAVTMPGMPQAVPALVDVCWDHLNGLTKAPAARGRLTIPGPGVIVR